MANLVRLDTLIQRVRRRVGMEGATKAITDWEITDELNLSLATELYDVCRASVGDNYYRRGDQFTTAQNTAVYDLPADFLSLMSVDVWLYPPVIPAITPRINARRYMEYERNYYQQILLGWSAGATVLYSLTGQTITFQPTPTQAFAIGINYVPVSPKLGGGQNLASQLDPNGVPTQPNNYGDTWDDINGWSETAVLDVAAKVCFKLRRLDMVAALSARCAAKKREIAGLVALRNAGEPERVNMPQQRSFGDGWWE